MLLRFIAENVLSFKEPTEFNLFPSSKSHSHEWHKVSCGHATAMRFSAIYGANGAGKSNLIELIEWMKRIVEVGSLNVFTALPELRFRFDEKCAKKPISMAIEFFVEGHVYYYQIEFDERRIIRESLMLSGKTKDETIFKRHQTENKQNLTFSKKYSNEKVNDTLVDAFSRVLRPDMPLLFFLANFYPDVFENVTEAYRWFKEKLFVVSPRSVNGKIPHFMNSDPGFSKFVNQLIPEFKTGISKIDVEVTEITEGDVKGNEALELLMRKAKLSPGTPQLFMGEKGRVFENVVFEDNKYFLKRLIPSHKSSNGQLVPLPMRYESDGTRKIVEYMPIFYSIINSDSVYVVDEMESSVHPIMIKEVMRKLSVEKKLGGQLVFSTHDSHLLDQELFRPDEIWFAEKDEDQATQLYPLSDFNIHKTANIENGYLKGRYGAIPFLSTLSQLHWNDDQEDS